MVSSEDDRRVVLNLTARIREPQSFPMFSAQPETYNVAILSKTDVPWSIRLNLLEVGKVCREDSGKNQALGIAKEQSSDDKQFFATLSAFDKNASCEVLTKFWLFRTIGAGETADDLSFCLTNGLLRYRDK